MKILMTDVPPSVRDSRCSIPLTVVVVARSKIDVIRPSISVGGRPFIFKMAATTGMLISGYMSVGIRRIVIMPIRTMSMANTTKV